MEIRHCTMTTYTEINRVDLESAKKSPESEQIRSRSSKEYIVNVLGILSLIAGGLVVGLGGGIGIGWAVHQSTEETSEEDRTGVLEDHERWLLAAAGTCHHMELADVPEDVVDSEGNPFIGTITFEFHTQDLAAFTDFPYHKALMVDYLTDQVKMLSNPRWDHRNIAVVIQRGSTNSIAVYDVHKHAPCTAEGSVLDCVHYTGHVSAHSTHFVASGKGASDPCQLLVDSVIFPGPSPSPPRPSPPGPSPPRPSPPRPSPPGPSPPRPSPPGPAPPLA